MNRDQQSIIDIIDSTLRTELVWEGKYDEDGNRREVDIAGCAMPMQKIYQRLNLTPDQIAFFCEKWQIAELAVFGSILRDDFRAGGDDPSDVDFLFNYLPDANMSLLRRSKMKIEIENLCQRSIDLMLITEVIQSHNLMRKKHILESARLIYVY